MCELLGAVPYSSTVSIYTGHMGHGVGHWDNTPFSEIGACSGQIK
jgi:hypothetical protein